MATNSARAVRTGPPRLLRPGLAVDDETADAEAAISLTEALRRDQWQIPPLPRAAAELTRLAADPEVPTARIVSLIEHDVSLAARILRLASSVAFGSGKVTDLRRAVIKIGNAGVRNVAMASAMAGAFRSGSLSRLARFEMEHSYAVACGSQWLSRRLNMDPAHGFLAGLMHDVGCLALLSVLSTGNFSGGRPISPATVLPVLANLHADAGALVATAWGLEESIIEAIRMHHMVAEATVRRSTLVVALADGAEEIHHPDAEEHMRALMNHPARLELAIGHTEVLELVYCIAEARADGAASAFDNG
jgi:HD-like signal output (HDOD) protein